MAYRSRRHIYILAAVSAVLTLQFMTVMNLAVGAPPRVAALKMHGQDLREVVAAGNRLDAPRSTGRPGRLAVTGNAVAPTVSIALMLMLDGALMVWLARPKERLT